MVAIPHIFHIFFCIKTLHGIAFSFRLSTLYNRFFINNCFSIRWQVINNNCYVDVIIVVICLCISVSKYLYFFSCPIAFCADLFTLSLLRPIFRYFSLIFCRPTFVLVVLLKQNICEIKPWLRFYLNTGGCI